MKSKARADGNQNRKALLEGILISYCDRASSSNILPLLVDMISKARADGNQNRKALLDGILISYCERASSSNILPLLVNMISTADSDGNPNRKALLEGILISYCDRAFSSNILPLLVDMISKADSDGNQNQKDRLSNILVGFCSRTTSDAAISCLYEIKSRLPPSVVDVLKSRDAETDTYCLLQTIEARRSCHASHATDSEACLYRQLRQDWEERLECYASACSAFAAAGAPHLASSAWAASAASSRERVLALARVQSCQLESDGGDRCIASVLIRYAHDADAEETASWGQALKTLSTTTTTTISSSSSTTSSSSSTTSSSSSSSTSSTSSSMVQYASSLLRGGGALNFEGRLVCSSVESTTSDRKPAPTLRKLMNYVRQTCRPSESGWGALRVRTKSKHHNESEPLPRYVAYLTSELRMQYPGVSSDRSRLRLLCEEARCGGFGLPSSSSYSSSTEPVLVPAASVLKFVRAEIAVIRHLGEVYRRAVVDVSTGNGNDAQMYVILGFARSFALASPPSPENENQSSWEQHMRVARGAFWPELETRRMEAAGAGAGAGSAAARSAAAATTHHSTLRRVRNGKSRSSRHTGHFPRESLATLEMVAHMEDQATWILSQEVSSSSSNVVDAAAFFRILYKRVPLMRREFAIIWHHQCASWRGDSLDGAVGAAESPLRHVFGLKPAKQAQEVGRLAAADVALALEKVKASNFARRVAELVDKLSDDSVSESDAEGIRGRILSPPEVGTAKQKTLNRERCLSLFEKKGMSSLVVNQEEVLAWLHQRGPRGPPTTGRLRKDRESLRVFRPAEGGKESFARQTNGCGKDLKRKTCDSEDGKSRPKKKKKTRTKPALGYKKDDGDRAVILHVLSKVPPPQESGGMMAPSDVLALSLTQKKARDKAIADHLFKLMTEPNGRFKELAGQKPSDYKESHFFPEDKTITKSKVKDAWIRLWDPILTRSDELTDLQKGQLVCAYFRVDGNVPHEQWEKRGKTWEQVFWSRGEWRPLIKFKVAMSKICKNFLGAMTEAQRGRFCEGAESV
eukprot:g931.t1